MPEGLGGLVPSLIVGETVPLIDGDNVVPELVPLLEGDGVPLPSVPPLVRDSDIVGGLVPSKLGDVVVSLVTVGVGTADDPATGDIVG